MDNEDKLVGVLGELEGGCSPDNQNKISNALNGLSEADYDSGGETPMRSLDFIAHLDRVGDRLGINNMREKLGDKVREYIVKLAALYKEAYPQISTFLGERGIRSIDAFLFTRKVFNLDWDYGVAVPGNFHPSYGLQKMLR